MHRRVTRGLVRVKAWLVQGAGHVQWQLVGLLGLALLITSSSVSAGVVMKWTRPLCGPAAMSQNDFTISETMQPQEARPMKQEMHVLGIDIAKRGDYSIFTGFWYGSRGACVVD
jgi:hypothetical protein